MTNAEIIRWSRIASLGPRRVDDDEWVWCQEHALEFNNRTGLKKELDLERKLLVSKFCEDDCTDVNAPLSELHILLLLDAEKKQ
jgi:nitrite reductase/ring-hydroxylating ferredoxin subunit